MGEQADYLQDIYYDSLNDDTETDWENEDECPSSKTCRRCGTLGLQWGSVKGKWRLFDGKSEHVCPTLPKE